jgi:hypothetical protein
MKGIKPGGGGGARFRPWGESVPNLLIQNHSLESKELLSPSLTPSLARIV